jgi:hypothetical protein
VQHTNHLLDLTVITSRQGKAMSYAIIYSRTYVGVDAPLVSVETHLSGGLPALTIVGIAGGGKIIYVIGEAMLL